MPTRSLQGPVQFKASLLTEENLVFGGEISIHIMFLEGDAVIHIVDTATWFEAPIILDKNCTTCGKTVGRIWLAFVMT